MDQDIISFCARQEHGMKGVFGITKRLEKLFKDLNLSKQSWLVIKCKMEIDVRYEIASMMKRA